MWARLYNYPMMLMGVNGRGGAYEVEALGARRRVLPTQDGPAPPSERFCSKQKPTVGTIGSTVGREV